MDNKFKEVIFKIEALSLGVSERRPFINTDMESNGNIDVSATGWFDIFGFDRLMGILRSSELGTLYIQYSLDAVLSMYQTEIALGSATDAYAGSGVFHYCVLDSLIYSRYARIVYLNSANVVTSNFYMDVHGVIR